jgi:ABC-type multidrug transport system fused ATPase/permease subunit
LGDGQTPPQYKNCRLRPPLKLSLSHLSLAINCHLSARKLVPSTQAQNSFCVPPPGNACISDIINLFISGLSKRYSNGVQELSNANRDRSSGTYGFLGRNGAGKSTVMRTLAALQRADDGDATLGQIDLHRETSKASRVIG